jgi:hypothetical protein
MESNTPLTLYNKIAGTETYQRTVIPAVEWENRKAVNGMRSGALSSNSARVFISMALGTNYLKPKAWQALTTKTGKWTLAEGDVIVKGMVTDEIHAAVPYSAGPPIVPAVPAFTVTSLKNKYDDVLVITSVDTFDMGSEALRHWECGAK